MRLAALFLFLSMKFVLSADLYTSFENGNSGDVVTVAGLNACTDSTIAGFNWTHVGSGSVFARTYITNSNQSFSSSVTVHGTAYDGSGTRAMLHGDIGDTNSWAEVATLHLPSMPNFGYAVSFGVFVYLDITNTTDTLVNFDFMWNGQAAFQMGVRQGIISYDAEGTAPTNFGLFFTLLRRHWYWAAGLLDYGAGVMKYQYFDPANNYASMGESVATIAGGNASDQAYNTHDLGFGDPYSTHLAGASGFFMWDNLVVDWSTHTYPILPTTTPPVTNSFTSLTAGQIIVR